MIPSIEGELHAMKKPALICIGCEGILSKGEHEIYIEFGCTGRANTINDLSLNIIFNDGKDKLKFDFEKECLATIHFTKFFL
jgi:hypothetical protein